MRPSQKLMRIAEIGVDMEQYLKVRGFLDATENNPKAKQLHDAIDYIYNFIEKVVK